VLKLGDIAVFVANWETKVDNIRYIQSVLNIGFDSMVFIDDNPFERNIVRDNIPGLEVPELPEDPSEYLLYLQELNLFETTSVSGEDDLRTQQYQQEAIRRTFEKSFSNEDEFLLSLGMTSDVKPFDNYAIPRVAELTQRSNQFNLRTIRYTENNISLISFDQDYITFSFTLKDKFGDHGLVSLIILKKINADDLFIDTWIMSCRVLKRTMEQFVLNQIVQRGQADGFMQIIGEYIPTSKNSMVRSFYPEIGFHPYNGKENFWALDIINYTNQKCFIEKL